MVGGGEAGDGGGAGGRIGGDGRGCMVVVVLVVGGGGARSAVVVAVLLPLSTGKNRILWYWAMPRKPFHKAQRGWGSMEPTAGRGLEVSLAHSLPPCTFSNFIKATLITLHSPAESSFISY